MNSATLDYKTDGSRKNLRTNDDEIEKTFELLLEAKKKMVLNDRKDIVLIWGATGAGKSTFTQWIASDSSNLTARETVEETGDFIIEDAADRIGRVTTKSKTIFPEQVVDAKTNTTYYDCPGFGDTRSASYDIASAYSIRAVTDHAQRAKILFVISHHSVKMGEDRHSFSELVRNVVDLISDMDKLSDSIAIVVTKVNNAYRGRHLVSDEVTIKGIAHFLREYKKALEDDRLPGTKNSKLEKSIKFVEILLTFKENHYPKIGIFRRPDDIGPLSEMDVLEGGKKKIHKMLEKELKFAKVNRKSFGCTISNSSKLNIISLTGAINKKISAIVNSIAQDVQLHFIGIVDEMTEQMKLSVHSAAGSFDLLHAQQLYSKFLAGLDILTNTVENIKELKDVNDLPKYIEGTIENLKCNVPQSSIDEIKNQLTYFNFFKEVSNETMFFDSLTWANSFQTSLSLLFDNKQYVQKETNTLATLLNEKISLDVMKIAETIENHFDAVQNSMRVKIKSFIDPSRVVAADIYDAESFVARLEDGHTFLAQLVLETKEISEIDLLAQKINFTFERLGIAPGEAIDSIEQKSKNFQFLQAVSNAELSIDKHKWSAIFERTIASLSSEKIKQYAETIDEGVVSAILYDTLGMVYEIKSVLADKLTHLGILQTGIQISIWQEQFKRLALSFDSKSSFASAVETVCSELDIHNLKMSNLKQKIHSRESMLAFLQVLGGSRSHSTTIDSQWKSSFFDVENYLVSAKNWYIFLKEAFEKLSDYSIQRLDTERFEMFIDQRGLVKNSVTGENFELLLNKMRHLKFVGLDQVDEITPTKLQLDELNLILGETIGDKVSIDCYEAENKLVVKGSFVTFSSFLSNNLFRDCIEQKKVKTIHVFSTNTVFFDMDFLEKGKSLKLIIIAPKWEVIGTKRKISLDGSNAQEHSQIKAGKVGQIGVDGLPGLPGGSAGSFFGIAESFVNSAELEVSANGGQGGVGQDGGDGGDGTSGEDAPRIGARCEVNQGFENKTEFFGTSHVINTFFSYAQDVLKITVYGKPGRPGGNSGKCGCGGKGGSAGKVEIIQLGEQSNVKTSEMKGKDGKDGQKGSIGRGGRNGNDLVNKCGKSKHGTVRLPYTSQTIANSTFASNGLMSAECNHNGQKDPDLEPIIEQKDLVINQFKNFMLENWNSRFKKDFTEPFYSLLLGNDGVKAFSSVLGLVSEATMLDTHANALPRSDIRRFYRSHLQNIENFKKKTFKFEDERKVLRFLYTTILSKMVSLETESNADLIVDIEGYLDMVTNDIKSLEISKADENMVVLVQNHSNDAKSRLESKIHEAKKLIESSVQPAIVDTEHKIREQIALFQKEMENLKVSTVTSALQALDKKNEIEGSLKMGMALGAVKALCLGLTFFFPATSALTIAAGGAAAFQAFAIGGKPAVATVPKNKTETTSKLSSLFIEISSQFRDDSEKLNQADQMLQEIYHKAQKYTEFEQNIYDDFIPMVQKMEHELKHTANELDLQSPVALDITKWQVQTKLREIKSKIEQFTQEFTAGSQLVQLIEKLSEAMTTLIAVYDRIENYHDQQKFSIYVANLNFASANNDLNDEALNKAVRRLKIVTRENVILGQYASVCKVFHQWAFPFANAYLKDSVLLKMQGEDSTDLLVQTALSQVQKMRDKLLRNKNSMQDHDKHVFVADFHDGYESTRPFFVWKNELHREMLKKLLSGETVVVKADVLQSDADKDAIKFNFIEINFKPNNISIPSEFVREISRFKVQMNHLGNSYYRYKNTVYVLSSESQSLEYSFQKKTDNTAVLSNKVHKKLLSGNILLSPYAMWEFKLMPTTEAVSFDVLKTFYDKVDLALEGNGTFVRAGSTKDAIDDFYQVDDASQIYDQMNDYPKNLVKTESALNSQSTRFRRDIIDKAIFPNIYDAEKNVTGRKNEVNCHSFKCSRNDFETFNRQITRSHPETETEQFSLISSDTSVNGTLALCQWIVGLFFNKNKTLETQTFLNAKNERLAELHKTENRIRSCLKFDKKLFGQNAHSDDDTYSK